MSNIPYERCPKCKHHLDPQYGCFCISEPVAPVEAKEKNRLTYEETKQRFGLPVAEPKPTPSTTPESHQMWCNISLSAWPLICTCVKPHPDSSSIPDQKLWLDQAVDLLNLYHSGYCPKDVAKDFLEKCKLNFGNVAEYKRFVDSSTRTSSIRAARYK